MGILGQIPLPLHLLKSDYFRIEIGVQNEIEYAQAQLKSDYFRIEMPVSSSNMKSMSPR